MGLGCSGRMYTFYFGVRGGGVKWAKGQADKGFC